MSEESYTQKARREKTERANEMGIDDALISELVETFYGHIRMHDVLGPIFASKIEDWKPHLDRMKDFWASIAMESGRYHGNPMAKHLAIEGLNADHFDIWLSLWRQVVDQIVIHEDAALMFKDRADRIAKSLQIGLGIEAGGFGVIKAAAVNKPYKSTPIFTSVTLPAALRKAHSTKEGVWGVIRVLRGSLIYTIEETQEQQNLEAPADALIIPQQYHFVTPNSDDMEMRVDFYRAKPDM